MRARSLILAGALVMSALWLTFRQSADAAPFGDTPFKGARAFTRADALALVQSYDQHHFGGWFSRNGRSHNQVMAIFQVESNFDPAAIGDLHLPDKSWGIGQVRGSTAADRGVPDPRALLDPSIGVWASMAQLKWSFDWLAENLGRNPTLEQWIGSYNAGVGAVRRGFIPLDYLRRWRAAGGA